MFDIEQDFCWTIMRFHCTAGLAGLIDLGFNGSEPIKISSFVFKPSDGCSNFQPNQMVKQIKRKFL